MAKQENKIPSSNWVTIQDAETGLKADFPHRPLEMTFEIPFQNIPPTGHVHLYSAPTKTGVFLLSTMTTPGVASEALTTERFKQFFDEILVPHLFYDPKVLQDPQVFNYTPRQIEGQQGAAFQIIYQDHGVKKKIEGLALKHENILCAYFYLASETAFDQDQSKQFLKSVRLAKAGA